MSFKVALVAQHAKSPLGTIESAGYDLYSCENTTVKAKDRSMINIGISISMPSDCYGRIAPRSGLAVKNGIQVLAGVIDSSYRGEIRVVLFNSSNKDFKVEIGDRIAQIIFERIYTPTLEVVGVDDLDETARGSGGFGSSGK